jgi:hypothetical protein
MHYDFKQADSSQASKIWIILQEAIQRRKEDGSNQWQDGYPNEAIVKSDIEKGIGYVLLQDTGGAFGPGNAEVADFADKVRVAAAAGDTIVGDILVLLLWDMNSLPNTAVACTGTMRGRHLGIEATH